LKGDPAMRLRLGQAAFAWTKKNGGLAEAAMQWHRSLGTLPESAASSPHA
jgi:hypothetical protein